MAEWDVKPRAAACAACSKPFTPESRGHSLLLHEAEEHCERRDLCPACFAALPKGTVQMAISAWTFTVPKAVQAETREAPVRRETAEALLRALVKRGDPRDRGALYVLAILMERSKRFIERSVTTNEAGLRIRLYEQRGTGDLFPIVDPGLHVADLAAVQQRVLELLERPMEVPVSVRVLRRRRDAKRYLPVLRYRRMR